MMADDEVMTIVYACFGLMSALLLWVIYEYWR